jgi:hypothetical protein
VDGSSVRLAETREAEVTELILGQEDHMPCPYTFCSAIVTTRVTMRYLGSPPEKMIVAHEIENEYLSGPCYAGLMWWPLGKYEVTLIRERERVDYHRILELSLAAELHGLAKPPAATPPAESRTLRGPQRMGREPATEGEESDAWQMGGRQDPDVQQPTMRPKVPEGVTGYEPGRHMATISEIESALAAAATQGTEAYGALNEAWQAYLEAATEKLDQAMNTIANVNDSQNSDLLAQAYAPVQRHLVHAAEDQCVDHPGPGEHPDGQRQTGGVRRHAPQVTTDYRRSKMSAGLLEEVASSLRHARTEGEESYSLLSDSWDERLGAASQKLDAACAEITGISTTHEQPSLGQAITALRGAFNEIFTMKTLLEEAQSNILGGNENIDTFLRGVGL